MRSDANVKPVIELSPTAVAEAQACVQCGLCLPACPTYLETGDEGHSPRGRINLMLGLHRGEVDPTPGRGGVTHHLDACLGCRACEPACPSGVTFHTIIDDARDKLSGANVLPDSLARRRLRWFLNHVVTDPRRLRRWLLPARLAQRTGVLAVARALGLTKLLPTPARRMERLLGDGPVWPTPLPEHSRGRGVERFMGAINPDVADDREPVKVGFLPGCVGDALNGGVNRKAAELLCAGGADVYVPRAEQARCCGAIPQHNRAPELAAELAREVIEAFEECELVCATIAGCGAHLRELPEVLAGDEAWRERAAAFSAKVKDVSEVLLSLELPTPKHALGLTAAYHAACHLHHAQPPSAGDATRRLLALVPGLTVIDAPEAELCCGAAGSYNLEHPTMADDLGRRKLRHLDAANADVLVMANVGCAQHVAAIARDREETRTILHPVELLHTAIFGES